MLISKAIAKPRDLHQPLPDPLPGLTNQHLSLIYKIFLCMWGHMGKITRDKSNATQFQVCFCVRAACVLCDCDCVDVLLCSLVWSAIACASSSTNAETDTANGLLAARAAD